MSGGESVPGHAWDVDALVDDPDVGIIVCCGSGGVGKTTTAAALGVRAAERGRRVVVLTIDPARRLAQSLGLDELDNTPAPVAGIDTVAGGRLDAMMLDMKRTFDEVVLAHASPDKAAQILANPFYIAVSSSFAGTQEYMAMEKLSQLRAQAERDQTWDLIVVDTPPSRSALDFLDAPSRLGSFLDGRFIRILASPARAGGRAYLRVLSGAVSVATSMLTRLLGAQLLTDVQTFIAALDTMFGGFRERAEQTYALLAEDTTGFVVVATPERDAMREASFFAERLRQDGMPLAGVVVNRHQRVQATGLSADRALEAAQDLLTVPDADDEGARLATAALLTEHATMARTAARHTRATANFAATHPGVPLRVVGARRDDIHDLSGLRRIGADLAGHGPASHRRP